MDGKSYNTSLIEKYLSGKLDAHAMHRLEVKAQDDPFLMDALDGYHVLKNQQVNIDDLTHKLHNRVYRSKKTFLLWPLVIAIISVLGFALIGIWWLLVYLPQIKKNHVIKTPASKVVNRPDLQPNPSAIAGSVVLRDTDRTDSANTKTKSPYPRSRTINPSKGTVDPSSVIADLNKQPYNISKPKTNGSATLQNVSSEPNGIKSNTLVKGVDSKAITNSNLTPQTSVNTAIKLSSANNTVSTARQKDLTISRGNIGVLKASSGSAIRSSRNEPPPVIKGPDIVNITGQVTASDNGKPIAGAALRIIGTQTGTISDGNGKFNIRMSSNQSLQVNYIDYYGKVVKPAGGELKIALQPVNYRPKDAVIAAPNNTADKNTIVTSTSPVKTPDIDASANLNTIAANNKIPNVNKALALPNTTTSDANKPSAIINTMPLMHVNGRVMASASNLPISSVVMWNRNADEQYRLQNDGLFDIAVHKGDEIYVGRSGFKTQKIKIKNSSHFDVVLEENNSTLYDNFVKGLPLVPYDDTAHPVIGWNKFKQYQKIKSTDGKTGIIKLDLTINPDNSVSNIKVVKSVGDADAIAIKIVKEQTKWMHNTNNQPENISVKFKVQ